MQSLGLCQGVWYLFIWLLVLLVVVVVCLFLGDEENGTGKRKNRRKTWFQREPQRFRTNLIYSNYHQYFIALMSDHLVDYLFSINTLIYCDTVR